jgi:hypothetical protein
MSLILQYKKKHLQIWKTIMVYPAINKTDAEKSLEEFKILQPSLDYRIIQGE